MGLFAFDKEAAKKPVPIVFKRGQKICNYGGDYITVDEKDERYGNATGPYVMDVDAVAEGESPSDPYGQEEEEEEEEEETESEEEDDLSEMDVEQIPATKTGGFARSRTHFLRGRGSLLGGAKTKMISRRRPAYRDAALNRGAGSMINHVNISRLINCQFLQKEGKNTVAVHATRNIMHKEELYCSYHTEKNRIKKILPYLPPDVLAELKRKDAEKAEARRAEEQKRLAKLQGRSAGQRKSTRAATQQNTMKSIANDKAPKVLNELEKINISINDLLRAEANVAKEGRDATQLTRNAYRFDEYDVIETTDRKRKKRD
jgi:hypothetical protein